MKVFAFNANTTMQRAYANYWRYGRLSLRYPFPG